MALLRLTQKSLKKITSLIPVLVLLLIVFDEWYSTVDGKSNSCHWAHIGGMLGAWLYLK